jgi:class 3 adenylate cyclase
VPDAERRLAAILSADVAGYSLLMAADEDATVRTLGAWREQVASLITEHRGQLADFTGDNFLGEFPAARDAVECALEIQRVIEVRNSTPTRPTRASSPKPQAQAARS